MRTVLFVPGFREDLTSRAYERTLNAIKHKGYDVKFISIQWRHTTLTDWTTELEAIYAKCDARNAILAGFSYGAMTALMVAAKRNPAELWLCSLSPYFADDMPHMRPSWLANIGHRRADVFRQLDFAEPAAAIRCKTLLFYGKAEYPLVINRSKLAHKAIAGSRLVAVPRSGHDVANERYITVIQEFV